MQKETPGARRLSCLGLDALLASALLLPAGAVYAEANVFAPVAGPDGANIQNALNKAKKDSSVYLNSGVYELHEPRPVIQRTDVKLQGDSLNGTFLRYEG